MKKRKRNGLMLILSALFCLSGCLVAETVVFRVLKPDTKGMMCVAAGVYLAVVGFFCSFGVTLAETIARRYQNSRDKRVMRKCVGLSLAVGGLALGAAGVLGQFVYGLTPGKDKGVPDVIFLLDRSGSMEGIMAQSADAVEAVAARLGDTGRAMVISFSDQTTVDFAMSAMTDETRQKIESAAENLTAAGNTDFDQALKSALEEGEKSGKNTAVLMLTDGQANISGRAQMTERLKKAGIRLYAVGFKVNSVNNRDLERLARDTGGGYQVVDQAKDIAGTFLNNYQEAANSLRLIFGDQTLKTSGVADVWRIAARLLGFAVFGALLGLSYSFIPNKKDVIFRNGIQGLAAGAVLEGVYRVAGGIGALPRFLAFLVMCLSICSYDRVIGGRSETFDWEETGSSDSDEEWSEGKGVFR